MIAFIFVGDFVYTSDDMVKRFNFVDQASAINVVLVILALNSFGGKGAMQKR